MEASGTTYDPAHGEGVLTPEQVNEERARVLDQREAELARREKALNTPPSDRMRAEAEAVDAAAVQARKDAGFYCPGCGRPWKYQRECTGTATAPHPAIEVVSSDELDGDPENHTPAPNTDVLG